MHLHRTYAHMGEATRGWTWPDMEAAQQLFHLSSDEEEYYCGNGGGRRPKAKKAAAPGVQAGAAGEEGRKAAATTTTREGKGAGDEELDDDGDDEGDQDGKGRSCSRKRRFRSIAYLYRVTRPVRAAHVDEAKRRKIIKDT